MMREFRCPIYGFIPLDNWEVDIISLPAFQRLRRIRQLAWTDLVYPGAMHSRFEHSLGVMHMATQLYDSVVNNSWAILQSEYGYDEAGKKRFRKLIRLSALLHDVGHGPFSHAAEDLMPKRAGEGAGLFKHEDYSTAIIREKFSDVIENHRSNVNYAFRIEEVIGIIKGKSAAGRAAIWQELIAGQLDADRMDYLLRDSYHAGVEYGTYDWRRLVSSVMFVPDVESDEFRLGVSDGGKHVAESLIIARYMMFNQIYFHKTRVIYDHHFSAAMRELLPSGCFPAPEGRELEEYLKWDDWRVLGLLSQGEGGEHAARLGRRDHYRVVKETSEFPTDGEVDRINMDEAEIADLGVVRREAGKSWYKVGSEDLPVAASHPGDSTKSLSMCSTIVGNMKPSRCIRLYVPLECRMDAIRRLDRTAE